MDRGQHRHAPQRARRAPLGDIDLDERRLSINRSVVSVSYEIHRSRGTTRTSRRYIDLDSTVIQVLRDWKSHRAAEDPAFDPEDPDAHVFAQPDGNRSIHS